MNNKPRKKTNSNTTVWVTWVAREKRDDRKAGMALSRAYRAYHPRVGLTQLLAIRIGGLHSVNSDRNDERRGVSPGAPPQIHLAWLLPLIVSLSLELAFLIDYLILRVINLAGAPLHIDISPRL